MSKERRKVRVGRVVSSKMDKTIIVAVQWQTRHPLYRKAQRRITKFYAHDGANNCTLGDLVRIEETRALSRLKGWRLLEILERREVAEVKPLELDLPILQTSSSNQMSNDVDIIEHRETKANGTKGVHAQPGPVSDDSSYDGPAKAPLEEITVPPEPTSPATEVETTQTKETPLIESMKEPIETNAKPRRKTTSKARKQEELEDTHPASDATSSKEDETSKPGLKRRSAKAKLDVETTTEAERQGIGEATEDSSEESSGPESKEEAG